MNHCFRCAAEPWVNESGTTRPVACRCSVSSPIADAVVSAASMSPASRKPGRFFSSRLTQTPDRQSACNSTLTCSALDSALLPQPRHARQDAEQVLDMMPGFMGDDIGRGEFAGIARAAAKPRLDLTEENGIEKNLLVRRAVERPHRRLRHAAAPAIGGVAKQHDARTRIGLTAGLEDLAPAIVDLAEDAGDHAAHLVGRRTGLGGRGPAIGLIARRLSATGKNLRAADQDARIDAEGVTDETEHDDGADAEAAAAHRKSDAAATAAAIIAATIIDVVAAAEVIVAHGDFSSFRLAGSALADTQRANHVKFPLRDSIARPAKIA